MQYSALAYRMRTMIANLNLRDDHGKLFTVGTHLFRHTYGKKLCDLLNDDATIAALLGHPSKRQPLPADESTDACRQNQTCH